MANYVENNLGKNEKIVMKAKISWLTLIPTALWFVIMVVVMVYFGKLLGDTKEATGGKADADSAKIIAIIYGVCLVIGVLPLLIRVLKNMTTHLAVTNKRVIGKVGVLKVDTIDFHIDKVDNVSYKGSVFGNLFHYYTVSVKGGGGDAKEITAIANAAEFKNKVNEAIELHAEEARKEQAQQIAIAMAAGKKD
ncbi:MAG: PH domain-containing protein [Clostridia bacterium]|nr:PH domain-containing protein [Clostridia bacterium]